MLRSLSLASWALLAALLMQVSVPALAQDKPADPPKTVTAALQPFVDHNALAGAVALVADKDKILAIETVGYADVAAKKAMPKDAMFWIASQSKPITAAGLMVLVDEGKVNIDDPVEKYLPEFKGLMVTAEKDGDHVLLKKPMKPITVKQILAHTSGMPFRSAMEVPTLDGMLLKDAVRSYAMTPLDFEPDTKYQYSNAGINTAARIIEVVSGMSYEDFMQKRLFDPLGMKDTTFWPNEEQLSRLAKSYKPNATKDGLEETKIGQLYYPLSDRKRQPMPAGGLFATAEDCAKFLQMVANGGEFGGKRILSEAAVKAMTTRQTPEALKESYGLGWSTGGGGYGHGGAMATNMTVDPGKGLILVWLVQHAGFPGDGGKAQGEFRKMAEQLYGKK